MGMSMVCFLGIADAVADIQKMFEDELSKNAKEILGRLRLYDLP